MGLKTSTMYKHYDNKKRNLENKMKRKGLTASRGATTFKQQSLP